MDAWSDRSMIVVICAVERTSRSQLGGETLSRETFPGVQSNIYIFHHICMHKSVFFRLCAIAFNNVYSAARSDSVQRRSIAMMRFVLTVFGMGSKGWACAVSGSAVALCIAHACWLFSWAGSAKANGGRDTRLPSNWVSKGTRTTIDLNSPRVFSQIWRLLSWNSQKKPGVMST